MFLAKMSFMAAILAASAAFADPLAEMDGAWRGSGWARETLQGPQETIRCQIANSYDAAALTLTLTGQCVVPGRRLSLAGTLTGSEGQEQIFGRWSNPDGIGSSGIVGVQRNGIVAFNFDTVDPVTGRNIAQNVEWRVSENSLRLRSTDRSNPSVMMSDITFGR
ncbi:hypothetical protein [Yoonia sp. 208BN28-4]|uniref:hypothetical protein n=1 Tax=Yoonia sp. 208BN28-4 TaxID=3126505 RepID=UPI003097846B